MDSPMGFVKTQVHTAGRGRTPPLRSCWGILRGRRGTYKFVGAYRGRTESSAPTGCVRVCSGAFRFAASYRTGGASPSPTLRRNNYLFTFHSYFLPILPPLQKCPNHETKPGKLFGFPGFCRVGAAGASFGADAHAAGRALPCAAPAKRGDRRQCRAHGSVRFAGMAFGQGAVPCACRTVWPVCVWTIGILALESTAALWG